MSAIHRDVAVTRNPWVLRLIKLAVLSGVVVLTASCAAGTMPGSKWSQQAEARIGSIGQEIVEANYPGCLSGGNLPTGVNPAVCNVSFHLEHNPEPNAAVRGTRVRLTTGMLRFARTTDELAFVLAHEVAHVSLGHQGDESAYRGQTSLEAEADLEAADLTQRAGFDPRAGLTLLSRMEFAGPPGKRVGSSHPSFERRRASLEKRLESLAELEPGTVPRLASGLD